MDSSLNGMLQYDGTYDYSPYRFAYSPASKNTMIAVDENGASYIFSSEKFKQIIPEAREIKYTFRLTKLHSLQSKSQLRQLL